MRGRKPKPVERQITEGDPSKRGKGKLERKAAAGIKASPGLPPCPRHLKGRSRSAWKFFSAELAAMKLDKRPDGPMLEGTCRAYERAVKADLILDKQGLTVEDKFVDKDGEVLVLRVRKHPAVEISNRSWLIVKAFCSEFGLTPVSRIRLNSDFDGTGGDVKDEIDKLETVLSKPRIPRTEVVH